ncbi:MAG TPA: hypothetical protein VD908_16150 [Cytophagales bacterium]|nr:hypothetical protein [Cytophagales bacterium]
MKLFIAPIIFLLLINTTIAQGIPQSLLGDWKPISYENLKTGEILNRPEHSDIIVSFLENGRFKANACNGINCSYSITEKFITLDSCMLRTKRGCLKWDGIMETSLGNESPLEYHFRLDIVELISKDEFVIKMKRI